MSSKQIYIVGLGLVSPAGVGIEPLVDAISCGERHIGELTVFPGPKGVESLPVAEVKGTIVHDDELPRTHALALLAAQEAMNHAGSKEPPDAIVFGGTTGGMPLTERLIRDGVEDPSKYEWHGAGTVADYVAGEIGCTGTTLTVATACSSGAVALKIGLELLRQGKAQRVLAGGVDALCRLTYHGFNMLKLIDPQGARPLDVDREGMTVGEGAALLLLTASEGEPPEGAIAVLAGGGLSCDAHHASSPHPEGEGGLAAMRRALDDAGLTADTIDGVLLHGTGTVENDASEAKGLRKLFGGGQGTLPYHASVKGMLGHAVGAAGAFGAAISALAIQHGVLPGNIGCQHPDPELALSPLLSPIDGQKLDVVLSNAFGFGGNNASLVMTSLAMERPLSRDIREETTRFALLGASCLTGAGLSSESLNAFQRGADETLRGVLDGKKVIEHLPKVRLRRVKRLTRIAMALAMDLGSDDQPPAHINSIFLGTSLGTLSETYDFLKRLYESDERFSSPTDFVGSVHNAVAGRLALWLGAKGSNITSTSGVTSFEDALFIAALLDSTREGQVMVLGLDEAHEVLSPRLDLSMNPSQLSDGGGALLLGQVDPNRDGPTLWPAFRGRASADVMDSLVDALGGKAGESIDEIWFGFQPGEASVGEHQLEQLTRALGKDVLLRDYRQMLGQYHTASAAATALACTRVLHGEARGILVVSLGQKVTALEIGG